MVATRAKRLPVPVAVAKAAQMQRLVRVGLCLAVLTILGVGHLLDQYGFIDLGERNGLKPDTQFQGSLMAQTGPRVEAVEERSTSPVKCNGDPRFPVCILSELIDKDACEGIIKQAEINQGYEGLDSLDQLPAMEIEIMERYEIQHPDLYELIAPYLPRLTAFTSKYYDVQGIYWIFLRKYAAEGNEGRKGVRIHQDSSGATAVILLNDEFEGGEYGLLPKEGAQPRSGSLNASHPNNKETFFPDLPSGSAMLHDGRIEHGVAAVTKGTRYSLIIFYNVNKVEVEFTNDLNEEMRLFWVSPDVSELEVAVLAPGMIQVQQSFSRHSFLSRDAAGQVRTRWTVGYYPTRQIFRTSKDCPKVDKSLEDHPLTELDGVRKDVPPVHSEF